MKVAQIGTLAGPGAIAGGVWQVQSIQSAALDDLGIPVRAIAGWLGPLPNAIDEVFPLDLMRVYPFLPRTGVRGIWSPELRLHIKNLARWADVAHVHLCRDFVTVPAIEILSDFGVPIVVQCHGMLTAPKSAVHKLYDHINLKKSIARIEKFLYLTNTERSDLLALNVPAGRLVKIDNACRDNGVEWSDPSDPQFIFASRLHPRKQPSVFVNAAIEVLRSGVKAKFRIVGPDQGERDKIVHRITESGLSDHFTVIDGLPNRALQQLLASSTAMVLPSVDEPYPMIVLEALAAGVPAIVTSQCGLRRTLETSGAALISDPTVQEITKGMLRLIEEPQLRANLSSSGRSLYESNWKPRRLAEHLQKIYSELVGT